MSDLYYNPEIDNAVDIAKVEASRSYALNIPFYEAGMQDLISLNIKGSSNLCLSCILPLNPYLVGYFRKHKKYGKLVQNNFINLPSGAGMKWYLQQYGILIDHVIVPKDYLLNLLYSASQNFKSVFLIGGQSEEIIQLYNNLKRALPTLNLVGKHPIFNLKQQAEDLKTALLKVRPDIVIFLAKYKHSLNWLLDYQSEFERSHSSFFLLDKNVKQLISEQSEKKSFMTKKSLGWLGDILKNPLRWFQLFVVLRWWFAVIRDTKLKKKSVKPV